MRIMKKQKDKAVTMEEHPLLEHYTFDYSKAKPNRFAGRISEESVMVVLEPDVAVVFNTSEAVNEALRVFLRALTNMPELKGSLTQITGTTSATSRAAIHS